MTAIEIRIELVHDVHFNAAHGVLVEWIPADAHYHGVDGGFVVGSGAGGQAGPAVVDAGLEVFVSADGEAGDGDVGCWDAELGSHGGPVSFLALVCYVS